MYSYAKQTLQCKRCNTPLTALDLLRQSRSCAPRLNVLNSSCPHCQASLEVKAEAERLSVGGIDGFPGPCFIVDSTGAIPGLKVETFEDGMRITCDNQVFNVAIFRDTAVSRTTANAKSGLSLLPLVDSLRKLLRRS